MTNILYPNKRKRERETGACTLSLPLPLPLFLLLVSLQNGREEKKTEVKSFFLFCNFFQRAFIPTPRHSLSVSLLLPPNEPSPLTFPPPPLPTPPTPRLYNRRVPLLYLPSLAFFAYPLHRPPPPQHPYIHFNHLSPSNIPSVLRPAKGLPKRNPPPKHTTHKKRHLVNQMPEKKRT